MTNDGTHLVARVAVHMPMILIMFLLRRLVTEVFITKLTVVMVRTIGEVLS